LKSAEVVFQRGGEGSATLPVERIQSAASIGCSTMLNAIQRNLDRKQCESELREGEHLLSGREIGTSTKLTAFSGFVAGGSGMQSSALRTKTARMQIVYTLRRIAVGILTIS
jgi:hypothetical protein